MNNNQTTDDSCIRCIHHVLFEFISARPEYYTHGDIFNVSYILLFCGYGFSICFSRFAWLPFSCLTHLAFHGENVCEYISQQTIQTKYIYRNQHTNTHTRNEIITMRHVRQFYILIFTHPMAMRLCLPAPIHFCINLDGVATPRN